MNDTELRIEECKAEIERLKRENALLKLKNALLKLKNAGAQLELLEALYTRITKHAPDRDLAHFQKQAVKVFANVIMGRFQEIFPRDASYKITLFDAIGIVLDALKEYE